MAPKYGCLVHLLPQSLSVTLILNTQIKMLSSVVTQCEWLENSSRPCYVGHQCLCESTVSGRKDKITIEEPVHLPTKHTSAHTTFYHRGQQNTSCKTTHRKRFDFCFLSIPDRTMFITFSQLTSKEEC